MENVYRLNGSLNFSGYNIPDHTRGALERYITHGIIPGDFLISVLTNDLMGAISRADHDNSQCLRDIAAWIYMRAPGHCWGDIDAIREYSLSKRAVNSL